MALAAASPPASGNPSRIRPIDVGLGETADNIFKCQSMFNNAPYTLADSSMVYQALEVYTAYKIDALVMLDEAGAVSGILSQRDYVRKVALLSKRSKETPCKDIMTTLPNLVVALPTDSLQKCMRLMLARDIRHLPILEEDGTLKGLLSIRDLIQASLTQKDKMIAGLSRKALGSLSPMNEA